MNVIDPVAIFHSDAYLAHNEARLAYLARMIDDIGLKAKGTTVLELGAGIGDHTEFWAKLGAEVTATDARAENVALINKKFSSIQALQLDLENPEHTPVAIHDIVYAFGILYHLRDPARALAYMADKCGRFLFLETCVSFGNEAEINLVKEPAENPSQAVSGIGCRPTRQWVFEELKKHFPYVYQSSYQPQHEEFPTDWNNKEKHTHPLARTVFVGAREPIDAGLFFPHLLDLQIHAQ